MFLAYSTPLYTPIAAILGIFWLIEGKFNKSHIYPFIMLLLGGAFLIWQIFPISNVLFKDALNFSLSFYHFWGIIFSSKYNTFNVLMFCYLIYLIYYEIKNKTKPSLTKNDILLTCCIWYIYFVIFILSAARAHHKNLTFGLVLFNLYIIPSSWSKKAYHFFIFTLLLHFYWGYCSILHDFKTDISSAKSVYMFLK